MLLRTPTQRPRHDRRSAFTLLEILVVVAIIVMLAGVGGYYVMQQYDQSKLSKAKIDAKGLAAQVETFKLKHDRWPTGIQELTVQVEGIPPLVPDDKAKDSEGKYYQMEVTNDQGAERVVVSTTIGGQKVSSLDQK